MSNKNIN